jgi:hypothetical protein
MDSWAMWFGYVVMVTGGLLIVCMMVVGATILSNKAQHKLVDTIGGWEVFFEYRNWLNKRKNNSDMGEEQ